MSNTKPVPEMIRVSPENYNAMGVLSNRYNELYREFKRVSAVDPLELDANLLVRKLEANGVVEGIGYIQPSEVDRRKRVVFKYLHELAKDIENTLEEMRSLERGDIFIDV